MRIRLTTSEARDLESIKSYIRLENSPAAITTVIDVLDSIEGLAAFPNVGRPGRLSGTRELVVSKTPFIAIYRVRRNVVWGLRVLHGAQEWP